MGKDKIQIAVSAVLFIAVLALGGMLVKEHSNNSSADEIHALEISALEKELFDATSTTMTSTTIATTTTELKPVSTDILNPAADIDVNSSWLVTKVSADEFLKLRVGPSTEDEVLSEMQLNSEVVATGRTALSEKSALWYEVVYAGQVGWTHSGYLVAKP